MVTVSSEDLRRPTRPGTRKSTPLRPLGSRPRSHGLCRYGDRLTGRTATERRKASHLKDALNKRVCESDPSVFLADDLLDWNLPHRAMYVSLATLRGQS